VKDQFIYLLFEGFRNLWRAKLPAFASIIAIGIATSFIGFGALVTQDLSKLREYARSQYRLEVFFSPIISDSEANQLVQQINEISGVRSTRLVTKQEAAEIFEKEFGENIFELLRENPLPSSCVVNLESKSKEMLDVRPIIERIKAIDHVDDVRYHGRLISTIEKYYQGFFTIITSVSVIVLLGTIILISNTIRLTIYSRQDLIRTLKLVGATNRFIRFPFMIEGVLEGLFGALFACAIIYGFVEATNYFLSLFSRYRVHWDLQIISSMIIIFVLLSAFGSIRAVRKFLV
jgi:cell division transport system permease protein